MTKSWAALWLLSPLVTACATSGLDGAPPQSRVQAEQSYQTCLASAVRYADDGKTTVPHLALIVAPMCYAQFTSFDKATTAQLGGSTRRKFEHEADQRQIETATAAIERARSRQAELSVPAAPLQAP